MRTYKSDVVIIGGGLAGICAALELLDAGKSVAILDRDGEENFGGLAKESFGGIFVVGSREQKRNGIRDSPAQAFADWCAFAEFGAGDHWPRRWAEAYTERCHDEVYLWLKANGIGFFPVPHWIERGLHTPGNSVARFHIVWGTGRELAVQLIARLRNHPNAAKLTLHFGHRVESFTTLMGGISGCSGALEEGGEPFEAFGEAIVVAAGGINGSLERVRQNWHADWRTPPQTILNGSHRYADGTLHDAVGRIGGNITHLDRMWDYAAGVRHWQPRKPNHGLSVVPPRSAIWTDWQGQRFAPPLVTGFDTRDLVTRVCATERQYSWQILNRKIALKELAVSGAEFNPSIRDKKRLAFLRDLLFGNRWLVDTLTANCEDVVVADTLPALVAKMNALQGDKAVDLETLAGALTRYDAQIARGPAHFEDEQLKRLALLRQWKGDRVRTCKFQKILDHKALPLIAIREFIISRKSLGGIQTDLHSRVLDSAGNPIPRLYAAGEATGFGGGGSHGLRALEGTFLGCCVLSGRIAGKSIAGRTP
ncbi:MAG: FAD-binding dehydrogenase [Rhodocyclales bacterium]|nr:FAD-binding dehydrogenase [Rhodocyclales bacterium]